MLYKKALAATVFFVLFSAITPAFSQIEADQTKLTDGKSLEVGITPIPLPPVPDEETKLQIDFINKDSKKIQVHIDYFVKISKDDTELFSTQRTHTSSGTVKIPFTFPDDGSYNVVIDVDGILFVPMPKESVSFRIDVGTTEAQAESQIPVWIRNNASWWSQGQIGDKDFVGGIQFLIKEGILQVSKTQGASSTSEEIPQWVRTNAGWWSEGLVSDSEFLNAIAYLIKIGIIVVDDSMKITSDAFGHNEMIPAEYTCDGADVSPKLLFSGVPTQAESLALIMDDPDAPMGTFVHWVSWNIPPTKSEIQEGEKLYSQGTTGFGKSGYGGPCPPSGTHRYFFKLYALDTELTLDENSNKSDLEQAMEGHILDKAEIIGRYSRK